ncbi:hypothetical protein SAMD00019534_098810 [Acytostelium subglobosum LB1]|uniref:hypothetical protein n=1 Tax=Acytostelium subglobosum LB1 TaxID=1410327 RepID=UPI0006450F63|nr:hypothetical protein SAMD00019534_098810 [Acytostelium subglobosum LB1]GAM26706.1 hypothetical protein SAMD00019534_098810 [Acytostelium subglobosum LB1]|eukprot:XP_012750367.1 hypothetical protein SAMD00019534_098810 [Acytostelium subglobosum LB1]
MVQKSSYKNFVTHWKLDTKKPAASSPGGNKAPPPSSQTSSSGSIPIPNGSPQLHQQQQQAQQQNHQVPTTTKNTSSSTTSARKHSLSSTPSPTTGYPTAFKSPSSPSTFQPIHSPGMLSDIDQMRSDDLSPYQFVPGRRKQSLGDDMAVPKKFHPYPKLSLLESICNNSEFNDDHNNGNNNNHHHPHSSSYDLPFASHSRHPAANEGGGGGSRLSMRRVSLPNITNRPTYSPERSLSPINERSLQTDSLYHHLFANNANQSGSNSNANNNNSNRYSINSPSINAERLIVPNESRLSSLYEASLLTTSPPSDGVLSNAHVHDKKTLQTISRASPDYPLPQQHNYNNSNNNSNNLPSIYSILNDVKEVSLEDDHKYSRDNNNKHNGSAEDMSNGITRRSMERSYPSRSPSSSPMSVSTSTNSIPSSTKMSVINLLDE